MTLVFQRATPGAGTHALVIGCGSYPNSGSDPAIPYLPPLNSAPRSAREFASWVLKQRDRFAQPLASLELLLAEPVNDQHSILTSEFDTAPFNLAPGQDPRGGLGVDQPSFAETRQAILDWKSRCDAGAHPENGISIFYAVGHGFQTAAQLYVPYDFGELPGVAWNDILALDGLLEATGDLKPDRQIFIGDCCRIPPPEHSIVPHMTRGNPILNASITALQRRRALLSAYSCPIYSSAQGLANSVSDLMVPLLKALDGAWCDDPDSAGQHWVTGHSIHDYLRDHSIAVLRHPGQRAEIVKPSHIGDAELAVTSDPGHAILVSSSCVIRQPPTVQPIHARAQGDAAIVWRKPVKLVAAYEVAIDFAPQAGFNPNSVTLCPLRPKPHPVLLKVS